MCGIAGFLTSVPSSTEALKHQAQKMSDAISHRGPDGNGFWVDPDAGVSLAHRRLAVVDLTELGNQPMISRCEDLVMVYNGEVYNAGDIAADLHNPQLKGTSDSEVILEAFSQWGIEKTIPLLVGMFAIAVWRRSTRQLSLVRDRLGIKPLYWTNCGNNFLFGSELKALRAHNSCPTKLNHSIIGNYLRKSYVNAPNTIYEKVHQLEPGKILTTTINAEPVISHYWSLHDVATHGTSHIDERKDEAIIDDLHALLDDAVKRRMIADVPFGAFLSGGVDSSAVVALMQKNSSVPVQTFSIGFEEKEYNEAQHAAAVAKHLKTEHTELYVTAQDALDVIPDLHRFYDEPFADASQIPTYLVSKMTREHVTVALSGDGGDELFAGYERYFSANNYQRILNQPKIARLAQAMAFENIPAPLARQLHKYAPGKLKNIFNDINIKRLPRILKDGSKLSLYSSLLWHIEDPASSLQNADEEIDQLWQRARDLNFNDKYGAFQYIDAQDYLTDGILVKVDRASMANSLEARVPLLDHRIVEFSWKLPERMKVRNGQGKWALRQVLYEHVPKELIERPKMGFGVPIDKWLRGPLLDWAENLLSTESLKHTNIFQPEVIQFRWKQHKEGSVNWQYHLWDVLMLQDWAANNI